MGIGITSSRFFVLVFVVFVMGAILATTRTVEAQVLGLGALLNPEGSRLFPQSVIVPRHPGKPDPRWRAFDWQWLDLTTGPTEFRLYFYREEEWTAKFAIPRIEKQVD